MIPVYKAGGVVWMLQKLRNGVTLTSVIKRLQDPEEYVANARGEITTVNVVSMSIFVCWFCLVRMECFCFVPACIVIVTVSAHCVRVSVYCFCLYFGISSLLTSDLDSTDERKFNLIQASYENINDWRAKWVKLTNLWTDCLCGNL